MFSRERVALRHRLAAPCHLYFWPVARSPRQMRGCIQGSLLAPHVSAIPLSPRPDPRQVQERARPIPCRTKATGALASGSCCAKMTKHKTSSRTDSQAHTLSPAQKTLSQVLKKKLVFQELIIAGFPKI